MAAFPHEGTDVMAEGNRLRKGETGDDPATGDRDKLPRSPPALLFAVMAGGVSMAALLVDREMLAGRYSVCAEYEALGLVDELIDVLADNAEYIDDDW